MSETPPDRRFVTNAELNQKIDELRAIVPTRWEVRFLILVGLGLAQLLPARDVANAAISLFQ